MNVLALPGAIRQIGFVVSDIDVALETWVKMGVGPWFVMRELSIKAVYRGHPCEVVQSIAMANSGALQIELIQQHCDTPSIFTEFVSADGEGFHQIAYWVDDFDSAVQAAEAAGYPVVWRNADQEGVSFAYVEPPTGPVAIIEIMELDDNTRAMEALVRGAAEGWDGTDPVRSLTG